MPDPHVFEQDPHAPQVPKVHGTENCVYHLFFKLHPVNFPSPGQHCGLQIIEEVDEPEH